MVSSLLAVEHSHGFYPNRHYGGFSVSGSARLAAGLETRDFREMAFVRIGARPEGLGNVGFFRLVLASRPLS